MHALVMSCIDTFLFVSDQPDIEDDEEAATTSTTTVNDAESAECTETATTSKKSRIKPKRKQYIDSEDELSDSDSMQFVDDTASKLKTKQTLYIIWLTYHT